MRCVSERSGAARGLKNDSLTGGIRGDYTSCGVPIKPNLPNSTRPQPEVQHDRDWLRE
jgi:hypothetical protein